MDSGSGLSGRPGMTSLNSCRASFQLRQLFKRRARIPGRPPLFQAEIVGDHAGADIARAAGNGPAGMAGGTGAVEIRYWRAVAEVVVHHLLGIEGAHEDVAAAHID